jgi:hypothetical protein
MYAPIYAICSCDMYWYLTVKPTRRYELVWARSSTTWFHEVCRAIEQHCPEYPDQPRSSHRVDELGQQIFVVALESGVFLTSDCVSYDFATEFLPEKMKS